MLRAPTPQDNIFFKQRMGRVDADQTDLFPVLVYIR
jgi:hypothetical protein